MAASISMTSSPEAFVISRQLGHFWHGSSVGPFMQFKDFAKILAQEVFPVPLGPAKRYAFAIRFNSIAFESAFTRLSCPTTSLKLCGLYFLNKGKYFSVIEILYYKIGCMQYYKNLIFEKPYILGIYSCQAKLLYRKLLQSRAIYDNFI